LSHGTNWVNDEKLIIPYYSMCYDIIGGATCGFRKKTVTVITEGGEHWTVSPHLLRKVVDVSTTSRSFKQTKLIQEHAR